MMSTLPQLFKKYYDENSRFEVGPPLRMMKELEKGKLVLSDMELSDEDISVLTRFFTNRKASRLITRIEINKSSGGKVTRRSSSSALAFDSFRLFKDLVGFIGICTKLDALTFENIEIVPHILSLLGRNLANSQSNVSWLAFKNCEISGDEGLKAIAPFLGKLSLQVLAIESCNLTDLALPLIGSLIKAQESNMDSAYWNATLRLDPTDPNNAEQIREETMKVYSCGLIALSLWGNKITGAGILGVTRLLRKNCWLLGLNLAENQINELNMAILVDDLKTNCVLQAILLRNNPGLDAFQAKVLNDSILEKPNTPVNGLISGINRLEIISPRVAWILKSWMRLQCEETRDLIQGHTSVSLSQHLIKTPQRPSIKESNISEYIKSYSIFSYLENNFKDNLNFPQNLDNKNISFNASEGVFYGGIEDPQLVTSFLTEISSAKNPKPNGSSRLNQSSEIRLNKGRLSSSLRHGAEYDESVAASFDVIENLHESNNHLIPENNFEGALNIGPTDKERWDYWPSNTQTQKQEHRPPTRMSIRPRPSNLEPRLNKSTGKKKKTAKLPHYMIPLSASQGKIKQENSPSKRFTTSHQHHTHNFEQQRALNSRPPWSPSNAFNRAPNGTRMRQSISKQKEDKTEVYSSAHNVSNMDLTKSKHHSSSKLKKKKNESNNEAIEHLTHSVLEATQNLEIVSKRLKDVADSLSESAILNMSRERDDLRVNKFQSDPSPSFQKRSSPQVKAITALPEPPNALISSVSRTSSNPPPPPINDQLNSSFDENKLADLVRERMQLKLRTILTDKM